MGDYLGVKNMKLTKEDIQKYATADEKKSLKEARPLYNLDTDKTFELKINLDNAAFEENPSEEIIHILKWLIQGLGSFEYQGTHRVLDSNGNTCGRVIYNK